MVNVNTKDVDKMEIQLKKLKETFMGELPNIILFLFLFFSIKTIWGSENIMLALLMPSYFKGMKGKKINIKKFIKDAILFTSLGILSYIATLNGLNMIILNVLVPFGIVLFLSDKYNLNKYILYGMIFNLFQMYAIPISRLYIRVIVFIYTFIVIFIAAYISSLRIKENPMTSTIKLGLDQVVSQFEAIYTDENYQSSPNPLVGTTNKLSALLYENAKNKGNIAHSKGLYYHKFTITFKNINQLIGYIKKLPNLDEATKKYFFELSCLIRDIKNKDSSQHITHFIKNNQLKNDILDKESKYILSLLLALIKSDDEKYKSNSINENIKEEKFNKISLSIESTKMRFAIRLSVVMLISGIIVNLLNPYIPKAYWLSLNAYAMMLPFYEDSTTRIFQRMKGTIIGLIVFYIAFHLLGYTPFSVTIFTVIGILGMFMLKTYYIRGGVMTSFALFLSAGVIDSYELIFLRMGLVLLAAILVYLANQLILPTGNYEELLKNLKELIDLDQKILDYIYQAICESKPIDDDTLNTCLLESEMISRNIETHESFQKKYGSTDISQGFLIYNQKLLLEFTRMAKIIANNHFNMEDINYFKEVILQVENSLTEIYAIVDKYYNSYDVDSDISIIDERLYMDENLISSIEKIYETNKLIYNKK